MKCPTRILLLMILLCVQIVFAKNFYVNPASGNIDNTGEIDKPWDTLQNVFRYNKYTAMSPGDSLLLMNGDHGSPTIKGKFDDYIIIAPYQDHQPTLSNVTFSGAQKIKLTGMVISPEIAGYKKVTLVKMNSSALEIIVENCKAYSVLDNSSWSASDWSQISSTGASIEGSYNILRNCHFLNVKHGILVENSGEHNVVEYNTVENFAADGMRGIGNYNTFQYNTIMNCYNVDDNHDDGFQSYSYGPDGVGKTTVYGLILRGNKFINYTDPNQPFRGPLQGIGCFDGMFEDWIVENNVIMVDHWHGITLLGAKNCRVLNNTIVDLNTVDPGPPWIQIAAHKDGTKSSDCVVRNNLVTAINNDSDIGALSHNMIINNSEFDDLFTDYANFDLSLKPDARAVDHGSSLDYAEFDILGTPRPQGDRVDIGAYEYTETTGVQENAIVPTLFELGNYPNPFNPTTRITYELQHSDHVLLQVYNVLGKEVATLIDEMQAAGGHSLVFDGRNLPSGLYLCKLRTSEINAFHKMILYK